MRRNRPTKTMLVPALAVLTAISVSGCQGNQAKTNPPTIAQVSTSTAATPTTPTVPSQASPDITASNWAAPGAAAITPLLAGDTVIAATESAGVTTLLALTASTGTTEWTVRLPRPALADDEDHAAETLKVIADDASATLYAAWPTANDRLNAGNWTVFAYDLTTGRTRWNSDTAPGAPLYTTPAGVAVGTGFAASDVEVAEATGTVMLAKATGKTLWTAQGTAPLGATVDTVLVASGTQPAGLAGVDPATGNTRWTHAVPGRSVTAEAAADHQVLVTLRDEFGAPVTARVLNAATGKQVGTDLALPADANFTAHIDRDTQVALVGTGSDVQGIDLRTGRSLWSKTSGPDPVSVAGSGLAWISATGVVVDSRTGNTVPGVNAEGVVLAGAGVALTRNGTNLTASALPARTR